MRSLAKGLHTIPVDNPVDECLESDFEHGESST